MLRNASLAGIAPIRNGSETTRYLQSMLLVGSHVGVDFRGKRDRNLKLWADIYTADGKSISRELVAAGYAELTLEKGDPALKEQLVPLQNQAKIAKLGLWGSAEPFIDQPIKTASLGDGQAALITSGGQLWVWGQFYEKPTMILEHVVQAEIDADIGVALKEDGDRKSVV